MRRCENCGTSIERKRRNARYCGKRCAYEARYSPQAIPGKCKSCGAPFVGAKTKRYCSKKCCELSRRTGPTLRACAQCGQEFMGTSTRKFCSNECRVLNNGGRLTPFPGREWLSGGGLADWLQERYSEEELSRARVLDPAFARRWNDWRKRPNHAADFYVVDKFLVRHFGIYEWEIPDDLFLPTNPRGRKVAA